jgi:transcriptional regulator with XRE-family HTH domain
MHDFIRPNQLKSRLARAGLTPHELAARTGLHHTTVGRTIAGSVSVKLDTLTRMSEALIAHETALRDYLIGLHGLPAAGAGCQAPDVREEEKAA